MAFYTFKMKPQDKFDYMQGGEIMITIAEKKNKSMLLPLSNIRTTIADSTTSV